MINNLATYMSAIGAAFVPAYHVQADVLSEDYHEVNEQIQVLSTYHGAIHKGQKGQYLEAEVGTDIQDGDMLLLFIATSGGVQKKVPHGFEEFIGAIKDKGDLTLTAYQKIWRNGDSPVYPVPKTARNFFVSMITLQRS